MLNESKKSDAFFQPSNTPNSCRILAGKMDYLIDQRKYHVKLYFSPGYEDLLYCADNDQGNPGGSPHASHCMVIPDIDLDKIIF